MRDCLKSLLLVGKTFYLSPRQGYVCSSHVSCCHWLTLMIRTIDIGGQCLWPCLWTSENMASRQKREAAFGPVISLQLLKQKCQCKAEPLIGNGINEEILVQMAAIFFKEKISVEMPKEIVSQNICLWKFLFSIFIQIYSWVLSKALLENTCHG